MPSSFLGSAELAPWREKVMLMLVTNLSSQEGYQKCFQFPSSKCLVRSTIQTFLINGQASVPLCCTPFWRWQLLRDALLQCPVTCCFFFDRGRWLTVLLTTTAAAKHQTGNILTWRYKRQCAHHPIFTIPYLCDRSLKLDTLLGGREDGEAERDPFFLYKKTLCVTNTSLNCSQLYYL